MKRKLNLLLIGMLLIGILNVKADAGPPMVAEYEIIVSNKEGATCYSYNYDTKKYVKGNKVVPFGTVYSIYDESMNGYLSIYQDGCDYLKTSDIKTKKDSFGVDNDSVEKITPVKAVILAKGGLNMRKGPAVAYSKITTIPQYSIVTLEYRAGTYWYYADFNGKKGWISGINQYFGYDADYILYSYTDTDIYDVNNKDKVIGTIPALTEVTDFLEVVYAHVDTGGIYEFSYYVNYNGVKGFVRDMTHKVKGQVKLLKKANIYDGKKIIKTVGANEILDFTIYDGYYGDGSFYIPSCKGVLQITYEENDNSFEIIGDVVDLKKTTGFIGSGLFGEKSDTTNPPIIDGNNEEINDTKEDKKDEPISSKMSDEMLIVCVLGSIIVALVIIIIILLVNKNKAKQVKINSDTKKEEKKVLQIEEENKISNEKGGMDEEKKE